MVFMTRKHEQNVIATYTSRKGTKEFLAYWVNIVTAYPIDAVLGKIRPPFNAAVDAAIMRADKGIERLMDRYPEMFSPLPQVEPPAANAESRIPRSHWHVIARIQCYLRLAWDAPDLRQREWHIFKARECFHSAIGWEPLNRQRFRNAFDKAAEIAKSMPDEAGESAQQKIAEAAQAEFDNPMPDEEWTAYISAPALTPFERAMYHFQQIGDLARHCPNPECPAPYFFATKRSQKYCSTSCSGWAQREQKRNWWSEHRAKQTRRKKS
jgi:hypothetical protein